MKTSNVVFFVLVVLIFSFKGFLYGEIVFGEKVEPIHCKDIRGNYLSIPNICSVSVLFFFNAGNENHIQPLINLDSLFTGFQEQRKNVSLYFIAESENILLTGLSDKYKLKAAVINDIEGNFSSLFGYKCGVCVKVVILDKKNTIRYHAEYIDLFYIQKVAERYESEDKDQINQKPGEKK